MSKLPASVVGDNTQRRQCGEHQQGRRGNFSHGMLKNFLFHKLNNLIHNCNICVLLCQSHAFIIANATVVFIVVYLK